MEILNHTGGATRREFMRGTGLTLAGMAAVMAAHPRAFGAEGGPELKMGLIGCGGRGSGAARNALLADPNVKLYAMADAFADQIEVSLGKRSNARPRTASLWTRNGSSSDSMPTRARSTAVTWWSWQPRLPSSDPHQGGGGSRPSVFAESPWPWTPRHPPVLDSCRKAKEKKLNIVSGLCYRYQFAKGNRETAP